MKKLKIAKFSNNEIAGFDGIGIWKQLPMLEEMDLNNNKITGFVGDWGDIPNLVLLDVCKYQQKKVDIPMLHCSGMVLTSFSLHSS